MMIIMLKISDQNNFAGVGYLPLSMRERVEKSQAKANEK